MKNSNARFLSPVIQETIRHEAVKLHLNGLSPTEISRQLCVSRQSVYNWIKSYSKKGIKGLKPQKRGRPQGSQLLPWQSAQVVNLIKNNCPDQLSMPFYLWTREAVSSLIKNKFGISISKWTVGRYLAKWGFSFQKPARRAIEQDPKSIKKMV
jgi:transposase